MTGGTTNGKRGRGSPRMRLDEAERQWHGPRRRHIAKHADRISDAFARELLRTWPACIGSMTQLYQMTRLNQAELQCMCRPPFEKAGKIFIPPAAPTPETDNLPPRRGWDTGATAEQERAADARMRDRITNAGLVVPVEHRGAVLHFGEHVQYMMHLMHCLHVCAWREWGGRVGAGPDGEYVDAVNGWDEGETARVVALLAEAAMGLESAYVAANPGGRIVGAAPPEPGMYDHCPPAQPTGEPRMDDGSHLLASERGRRRIDPATGMRMIRTMVLTADAWPHWEWSEDVAGAAGVGPWGPNVSFGTPEEPAQMSPRESMRGHLTRIGRLDLLHKYLPWEGDPPL